MGSEVQQMVRVGRSVLSQNGTEGGVVFVAEQAVREERPAH